MGAGESDFFAQQAMLPPPIPAQQLQTCAVRAARVCRPRAANNGPNNNRQDTMAANRFTGLNLNHVTSKRNHFFDHALAGSAQIAASRHRAARVNDSRDLDKTP